MKTRNQDGERRRWRRISALVALPVVAVLGIAATEHFVVGEKTRLAGSSIELPDPGYGPKNYEAEFATAQAQLGLNVERVANGPDQWLRQEHLARAHLAQFKLTADPVDLQSSRGSLNEAHKLAPTGTGPLLSLAELSMAMHELDAAQSHLKSFDAVAVRPDLQAQAEAVALHGDIAFYKGDMGVAAARYDEADSLFESASVAIRKAVLAKSQARFDEAVELVRIAAWRDSSRTPRSMAFYALQIGMIESARGNYEGASSWYQKANDMFPGYWLTRLYLAEANAVAGNVPSAIADLKAIALETGEPQAMDATAFLLLAQGQTREAKAQATHAAMIWRERVQQLPNTYIAHAFESELVFGNPTLALKQARYNLARRPYGEAHILVAEAYMATGSPDNAKRHLLIAEEQGWRSAPLYALLSEAEDQLGNVAASKAAAASAKKHNPHIFAEVTDRLWFGHG
jgi:tetratricopeptide (TPR) repeat protein